MNMRGLWRRAHSGSDLRILVLLFLNPSHVLLILGLDALFHYLHMSVPSVCSKLLRQLGDVVSMSHCMESAQSASLMHC